VLSMLLEKYINQQPTLQVREGMRGNIFIGKDIILPPYNRY
jgi:type IV secretory pathway VirB10-like protein